MATKKEKFERFFNRGPQKRVGKRNNEKRNKRGRRSIKTLIASLWGERGKGHLKKRIG